MNPDTGEMREFAEKHFKELLQEPANKGFVALPQVHEVLEIHGCKFVVKSYDTEKREMVLMGISNEEARQVLMGKKLF